MEPAPFPFDAVLFDLDGTLVATERFWPDAARAGALRAFAELGIEREPPTRAEWLGMCGRSVVAAFGAVFGDLEPAARELVLARCLEEERRALDERRAELMPGAAQVLEALAARGVRLGVASNCAQGYLDAMLEGLGLARWIEAARCLDSPGVGDKAGMVADLLLAFGTRSAVMVGDRVMDRDAAWANGLPHVHLARGYAEPGEEVACEAVVEGLEVLVARLEARARWIDGVAGSLGLAPRAAAIGITGRRGSGRALFARDLARALERRGRRVRTLDLEHWRLRGVVDPVELPPGRRLDGRYDVRALVSDLLEPHARGEPARVPDAAEVAPGTDVVLHGPMLVHPILRARLARVVHLAVQPELLERRLSGSVGRVDGPRALEEAFAELAEEARFEHQYEPERADLVLPADNPLGPEGRAADPAR